jgi:hypothetical protein
LAETPSTALRWFSKLGVSGLGTTLQAVPLQRMVRVLKAQLPGTLWLPTAQALPAENDLTPSRWFWALTLGLGTMRQELPFQRSVRVRLPSLELVNPTAQASPAEVASTSRSSPPPGGSGLAEMLQLLPFQRSITGRWMGRVPVSARPTAQALLVERASAPQRTLENWVRLGLDTAVQVAAAAGVASATASRVDQRARWARDQRGRSDDRMAPPDVEAHTTAKKFVS